MLLPSVQLMSGMGKNDIPTTQIGDNAATASTTSCWVMLVDIHTTTELPTRLRCPIAASIAPLVLASQLGFTWGETRFRITPSSTLEIRSVCLCFSLGVACVLPPRIDQWDASDDLLSVEWPVKGKKILCKVCRDPAPASNFLFLFTPLRFAGEYESSFWRCKRCRQLRQAMPRSFIIPRVTLKSHGTGTPGTLIFPVPRPSLNLSHNLHSQLAIIQRLSWSPACVPCLLKVPVFSGLHIPIRGLFQRCRVYLAYTTPAILNLSLVHFLAHRGCYFIELDRRTRSTVHEASTSVIGLYNRLSRMTQAFKSVFVMPVLSQQKEAP